MTDTQETPQEMLDRLSLIAIGDRECDMSDSDLAALEWALVTRNELLVALKAATQWLHDNHDGDEPLGTARRAIAKAEGQ